MAGASAGAALAPILLLLVVLATDVWVYRDATARDRRGAPVVATIGTVRLDTPAAWFLCCLVLWIVGLPLYLAARGQGVS